MRAVGSALKWSWSSPAFVDATSLLDGGVEMPRVVESCPTTLNEGGQLHLQPHPAHVISPRFTRAGSTRYPQRRQFAPSSLVSNGSATRREGAPGLGRGVVLGWRRGAGRSTTSSATACLGCHAGRTWTTGCGAAATGASCCAGAGGDPLPLISSPQAAQPTSEAWRAGASTIALALCRRCTTCTTRLLRVPLAGMVTV